MDSSRSARRAGGTGARVRPGLSGALVVAATGLAHVVGPAYRERTGGGVLGTDGLYSHAGALLRAKERTGGGPTVVCRQCAGRFVGRALLPDQRVPALSRPGCAAHSQRQAL